MRILIHTVIRLVGVTGIGIVAAWLGVRLNPHDDDGLGTGLTVFMLIAFSVGGWALADGAIMGWRGVLPWLVVTAASPFLIGWSALDDIDLFAMALVGVPAIVASGFGAAVHHALDRSSRGMADAGPAPTAPPQA
jgi:hypothetical protein